MNLKKNKCSAFYAVCAFGVVCSCTLKELLSSSLLSPHSHVILHAGLARSCRIHILNSEKNLLPEVRFPSGRLRVLAKVLFPGTHPQSATILPLPEGEGNLMDDGFCDFALGSAQNDRVEDFPRIMRSCSF